MGGRTVAGRRLGRPPLERGLVLFQKLRVCFQLGIGLPHGLQIGVQLPQGLLQLPAVGLGLGKGREDCQVYSGGPRRRHVPAVASHLG